MMKTGSFSLWLKQNYPGAAFNKDGSISKTFVRTHYKSWNGIIRPKAVFFLNTVNRLTNHRP